MNNANVIQEHEVIEVITDNLNDSVINLQGYAAQPTLLFYDE